MSFDPRDAARPPKTHSSKLGSFRQNTTLARPYIRVDEDPEAFDCLADEYRGEFHPDNPESEAIVNALTYIGWRICRHRSDELCVRLAVDNPDQPAALASTRAIIQNLEQLSTSLLVALEYIQRLHTLDAAEAMEDQALQHNLGSFLQNPDVLATYIPGALPPRTKPN